MEGRMKLSPARREEIDEDKFREEYRLFVERCNRITDRDIEENERRRRTGHCPFCPKAKEPCSRCPVCLFRAGRAILSTDTQQGPGE